MGQATGFTVLFRYLVHAGGIRERLHTHHPHPSRVRYAEVNRTNAKGDMSRPAISTNALPRRNPSQGFGFPGIRAGRLAAKATLRWWSGPTPCGGHGPSRTGQTNRSPGRRRRPSSPQKAACALARTRPGARWSGQRSGRTFAMCTDAACQPPRLPRTARCPLTIGKWEPSLQRCGSWSGRAGGQR